MSSIFSQKKEIRQRFLDALQKYGFKQVDVAKDILVHHSTLSQWIQGKTKGNTKKIEDSIEIWLNNLYSNKPRLAGTNLSRFELLKGKRERSKLYNEFDNNYGFDNLIPININIELEGKKYKDIFFWNLNEPYLTVESFAKILCEDNNLPNGFETEIINHMNKQISQYKYGKYENLEGEILKTIKIEIRIDDMVYNDTFEWDINNPLNNPENFAMTVCKDIGLGSEFVLPISHSIREQVNEFQKAAVNERKNYYYNGYYSKSSSVRNRIDINNFLRDIYDDESEWQPEIKQISLEEIKKFEKKEERKNRYAQRRNKITI
jgi:SWI/SNF-related matrix-associated actin-dependent regulator of chromatin subfamily B protein 1